MTENDGSEVDRAAAEAWVRFQARLGDRLADMEDGDVLVVEAMVGDEDEPGAAPFVQFVAWGDEMLRGEVASNQVLMVARELDGDGERAIQELGYGAPTHRVDEPADLGSLNYYVDLPQAEADRLAVMSVRALRDVFGVPHPALLGGELAEEPTVPEEPAAADRADEPVAAYPHGGHEALSELVDRALFSYFGHEPRHDDDGDIAVELSSTVLFVRVHQTVPVVELFACVATDVQDLERAAFEVSVLNRDVRFVKFRVVGDSIMADLQLPAWPFAPDHLRAMLALMTDSIEQVATDLVERVSGHHVLGDPDAEDEDASEEGLEAPEDGGPGDTTEQRSPAIRAAAILAQLDAERPGSVEPELAASICDNDPGLILDLIAGEERRRVQWRTARDEWLVSGETDVEGCDHEIDHAHRTISLLRRALRVVMERQAARDEAAPAPVVRRQQRRRPSRPSRVPDPTIEEVDPEIWS